MKKSVSMFLVMGLVFLSLATVSTTVYAVDVHNINGSPTNGTYFYPDANITVSVYIYSITGTLLNYTIRTNCTGAWATIESVDGVANSTVTDTVQGFNGYSKKYYWSVNTSNYNGSREWDNNSFFFYTRATSEPTYTGTGGANSHRVYFYVTDANGNKLNGAKIRIDGNVYTTNPLGEESMTLDRGTYDYTVEYGAYEKEGTLTLDDDKTLNVVLGSSPTLSTTDDSDGNVVTDNIIVFLVFAALAFICYRLYTKKRLW